MGKQRVKNGVERFYSRRIIGRDRDHWRVNFTASSGRAIGEGKPLVECNAKTILSRLREHAITTTVFMIGFLRRRW